MPLDSFARLCHIEFTDAIQQTIDQKCGGGVLYHWRRGRDLLRHRERTSGIVDVVLHDQRSILTVCAPSAEVAGVRDVAVALPRLIGGSGVRETFPLPLGDLKRVNWAKALSKCETRSRNSDE